MLCKTRLLTPVFKVTYSRSHVSPQLSKMFGAAVISYVLPAVLLLPLAGALPAGILGSHRGAMAARVVLGATALSTFGALALLVSVSSSGPVSAGWNGTDGRLLVGVGVDRLTAVLLLLVCAVSTLVQGYAARYLAGDRRQLWFVVGTAVLTTASAGLMAALTLIGLAVCWSAAGVGLWLLLGTYPDLSDARDGRLRTARAFVLGDVALWVAVGLATVSWGNLDLRELGNKPLPAAAGVLPLIGALVVVAAASRSSQVPFQRWLPATLAAPTPVSALLHAGVVNAGGVLLIRLAPLSSASRLAMGLAFGIGAVTAVYGTVLMLTKPDVKGALAHSTMGQMGFMIMTCGLGLYAAAVIHLVLHGLYKATLFLASGTAVQRHIGKAAAPSAPPLSRTTRLLVTAIAVVAPGLLLWIVLQVLHPALTPNTELLLAFAWATAGATTLAWLRRHHRPLALFGAVLGVTAFLTGYVALIAAADRFLERALPTPVVALPGTGWLLVAVLVGLGLIAILSRPWFAGRADWLGTLHRRVYVMTLTAGHVSRSRKSQQISIRETDLGWSVDNAALPVLVRS